MAKTIVEELKDLYVKFGGNRADVATKETVSEMLDAIEQIYNDAASAVKATFTKTGDVYSCDKTMAEINEAVENGEQVFGFYDGDVYALEECTESSVRFMTVGYASAQVVFEWLSIYVSGSEEAVAHGTTAVPEGHELPLVTGEDNGKVLTVSSGAWAAVTPANPEFQVTYTPGNDPANDPWTCDKTFAEIIAAVNAGKNVTAKGGPMDIGGGTTMTLVFKLGMIMNISGTPTALAFEMSAISSYDNSLTVYNIIHDVTDTNITLLSYTSATT